MEYLHMQFVYSGNHQEGKRHRLHCARHNRIGVKHCIFTSTWQMTCELDLAFPIALNRFLQPSSNPYSAAIRIVRSYPPTWHKTKQNKTIIISTSALHFAPLFISIALGLNGMPFTSLLILFHTAEKSTLSTFKHFIWMEVKKGKFYNLCLCY